MTAIEITLITSAIVMTGVYIYFIVTELMQ